MNKNRRIAPPQLKMMLAEAEHGAAAEGYSVFELPSAEYLVCGFEAESFEELTNSAVYKAQTSMESWMKERKLTTTDFAGEMYYPVTNDCAYLEHWMLPVPNKYERCCGMVPK